MTRKQWQEIERIFTECLELPEAEREGHLKKECRGDLVILKEVLKLLETVTRPPIIEEPFVPLPPELPKVGEHVDAYLLLEELEPGGFGRVYRARDENVGLEVALKVMRPDKLSPVTLRMFHEERRIQAQLHHNNIARLLSGGTTQNGLPYFVMQYVEGFHLDTHCSKNRFSIRERLELFHKVCLAVRYAHRNAVVHRDLKPRNVLVTESGEPMLLDFGIAKLLERRIGPTESDSLAAPMLSATIPLTLPFASPEQLEGKAVTTASDVYSLGVILYELLTGQSPYQLEDHSLKSYDEAIRNQVLRRPSAVARRPGPDDTTWVLPESGTPRPARGKASGLDAEIDSIVMKALEKNPDDRYDGAGSFAEDIRNYLDDYPVEAHPKTLGYVARTFVRRRKFEVAISAVMLFLVFFGFGMSVISWREHKVANSMLELFQWMQNPGSDGTLKEKLEEVSDEERLAVLLNDEAQSLEDDGHFGIAEPFYREALAMKIRLFGKEPHESVAIAFNNLAANLAAQGKYEEAERLYRESLSMREKLYGRRDLNTAKAMNNLGVLLQDVGRFEEAEPLIRESLDIRLEKAGPKSKLAGIALNNLAFFDQIRGDYESAEAGYEEALEIFCSEYGPNHPNVAIILRNQASLHLVLGDAASAEALSRKALEIFDMAYRHWKAADAESVLGGCLLELGRPDEAKPLLKASVKILKQRKGPFARQTREAEDRVHRAGF